MKPVIDYSIYLVTDTVYFKDDSIYNKLEAALSAGVTLLQYRDKSAETRILYERALKVKALCDKYRVPLIINDRADIAFAVKAAGVHLGQGDLGGRTSGAGRFAAAYCTPYAGQRCRYRRIGS